MLRYYDGIGLLKPARIDRFTGYRYYSEEQLYTAGWIAALKEMGSALSDIAEITGHCEDRAKLKEYLTRRRRELEMAQKETAYRPGLLDAAESRLKETMTWHVCIKTIPERYAATLRMTLPCCEDENRAWRILCEETEPLHVLPSEPCLLFG